MSEGIVVTDQVGRELDDHPSTSLPPLASELRCCDVTIQIIHLCANNAFGRVCIPCFYFSRRTTIDLRTSASMELSDLKVAMS